MPRRPIPCATRAPCWAACSPTWATAARSAACAILPGPRRHPQPGKASALGGGAVRHQPPRSGGGSPAISTPPSSAWAGVEEYVGILNVGPRIGGIVPPDQGRSPTRPTCSPQRGDPGCARRRRRTGFSRWWRTGAKLARRTAKATTEIATCSRTSRTRRAARGHGVRRRRRQTPRRGQHTGAVSSMKHLRAVAPHGTGGDPLPPCSPTSGSPTSANSRAQARGYTKVFLGVSTAPIDHPTKRHFRLGQWCLRRRGRSTSPEAPTTGTRRPRIARCRCMRGAPWNYAQGRLEALMNFRRWSGANLT